MLRFISPAHKRKKRVGVKLTHTRIQQHLKNKMKEETIKMESIEDEQWMKHATHRGDLSQPNPR